MADKLIFSETIITEEKTFVKHLDLKYRRKIINVHGHKYVALPAPSLHGNNRECGAKEGNIIVSRDFTSKNHLKKHLLNH